MHPLVRHPASKGSAVRRLDGAVTRLPDGRLRLDFRLVGDLGAIAWPAPSPAPGARDGLWRQTVFEAFFAAGDGAYHEYNFSPSGDYAAYDFTAIREGMTTRAAAIAIASQRDGEDYRLSAHLSGEPALGAFGLTAIVVETDGATSWWALAHPPGAPDFHHPTCLGLRASDIASA